MEWAKKIDRYKLICFDADHSAACVILNTCLNNQLDVDMTTGSVLSTDNYQWVLMDPLGTAPNHGAVLKAVLFVNDFTWTPGPHQDIEWEDIEKHNPRIHTVRYPASMTKDVTLHQHCIFTKPVQVGVTVDTVNSVQKPMSRTEIERGDWVLDYPTRLVWTRRCARLAAVDAAVDAADDGVGDLKENAHLCECHKHGLQNCIVDTKPCLTLDWEAVFQQAVSRMSEDDLEAECFDDLPAGKKRWCMCWWCAVNIFNFKKRTRPPSCFYRHIGQMFPNEPGVSRTGYKATGHSEAQEEHGII